VSLSEKVRRVRIGRKEGMSKKRKTLAIHPARTTLTISPKEGIWLMEEISN
jgi:hypothetical protein